MNIEKYVREGYLKKIPAAEDLVAKEFKEAEYDLLKAQKAISDEDYKWATIKAYYAVFHSAKAILFNRCEREIPRASVVGMKVNMRKGCIYKCYYIII